MTFIAWHVTFKVSSCLGCTAGSPQRKSSIWGDECPEPSVVACYAFAAELTKHMQHALEFSRAHQDTAKQSQKPTVTDAGSQQPSRFVTWCSARNTLSNARRGISAKPAARHAGPFRLVDQVGDDDFLLCDPASGQCRGVAHADQLAFYHGPWESPVPPASHLNGGRTVRRGRW